MRLFFRAYGERMRHDIIKSFRIIFWPFTCMSLYASDIAMRVIAFPFMLVFGLLSLAYTMTVGVLANAFSVWFDAELLSDTSASALKSTSQGFLNDQLLSDITHSSTFKDTMYLVDAARHQHNPLNLITLVPEVNHIRLPDEITREHRIHTVGQLPTALGIRVSDIIKPEYAAIIRRFIESPNDEANLRRLSDAVREIRTDNRMMGIITQLTNLSQTALESQLNAIVENPSILTGPFAEALAEALAAAGQNMIPGMMGGAGAMPTRPMSEMRHGMFSASQAATGVEQTDPLLEQQFSL